MYTKLYVYMAYRQYMSGKLYWRYKKDGKWTWRSAVDLGKDDEGFIVVVPFEEEEE